MKIDELIQRIDAFEAENFYFNYPRMYNGRIIWHEGFGYSTHT